MRLIDADKLNIYDISPADGFTVMGVTEEDIALAPSIEIIRCGECKHGEYREDYDDYLCRDDGICVHDADWFCADGERREP